MHYSSLAIRYIHIYSATAKNLLWSLKYYKILAFFQNSKIYLNYSNILLTEQQSDSLQLYKSGTLATENVKTCMVLATWQCYSIPKVFQN